MRTCGARILACGEEGMKNAVCRMECVRDIWRMRCGIWRVKCGIWRVKYGEEGMKNGLVWKLACGVSWRAACGRGEYKT